MQSKLVELRSALATLDNLIVRVRRYRSEYNSKLSRDGNVDTDLLASSISASEVRTVEQIARIAMDRSVPEYHSLHSFFRISDVDASCNPEDSLRELVSNRAVLQNAIHYAELALGTTRLSLGDALENAEVSHPVTDLLLEHLSHTSDPEVYNFVKEAVICFESGFHRAAVVLSWIGALAVLYAHVVASALPAFNQEATKRNSKWKDAKVKDDLSRMSEHEFLQILEATGLVGKSEKQSLENCLKLRNGSGHPNSLRIGENMVSAHLEALILNVFTRFPK